MILKKMNIVQILEKLKFIPETKLLELYPPFLFMGVKILEVSPDYRRMKVKLPLRWYGKNMHGTLFGGWISAVTDPLAALLCLRLFPGTRAWTKMHSVNFIRPASTDLIMDVVISEKDVNQIEARFKERSSATHRFRYTILDQNGRKVARVHNTVYLRKTGSGTGHPLVPED